MSDDKTWMAQQVLPEPALTLPEAAQVYARAVEFAFEARERVDELEQQLEVARTASIRAQESLSEAETALRKAAREAFHPWTTTP